MLRRLAHRGHACEQGQRREGGVGAVQQAQLALAVQADVGGEHDRVGGGGVDRERRPQRGRLSLDGPQGIRLGNGEQLVRVAELRLQRGARVGRRAAGSDTVHERRAEVDVGREPRAKAIAAMRRQLIDHGGEARPVVGDELGGDDVQRRAVGQPLEARVQHVGQPGRETTLQPEPGFGHVADDHLQLGLGDGGAHRRPLRVGDERAGDGADHVGALDRRAIAQAAFHQREQAVLGVDRARAALRRALDDDDAPVERARPVGGVHRHDAQGAQQHARAELQHALGQLVPAVGALWPVGPS